mgnify:CR=1 FL=1
MSLLSVLQKIPATFPAKQKRAVIHIRPLCPRTRFSKKDTQILKEIKEYATIPLITKLADARNLTSATQVLLNLDIFASDLYESIITEKFGTPFTNEYQKQLQII